MIRNLIIKCVPNLRGIHFAWRPFFVQRQQYHNHFYSLRQCPVYYYSKSNQSIELDVEGTIQNQMIRAQDMVSNGQGEEGIRLLIDLIYFEEANYFDRNDFNIVYTAGILMNELNKHEEILQYIEPRKERFIDNSELKAIEYGYIVGMALMKRKQLMQAVCILDESIEAVVQNEATIKLLPFNLKLQAEALKNQGHVKAAIGSYIRAIQMMNEQKSLDNRTNLLLAECVNQSVGAWIDIRDYDRGRQWSNEGRFMWKQLEQEGIVDFMEHIQAILNSIFFHIYDQELDEAEKDLKLIEGPIEKLLMQEEKDTFLNLFLELISFEVEVSRRKTIEENQSNDVNLQSTIRTVQKKAERFKEHANFKQFLKSLEQI